MREQIEEWVHNDLSVVDPSVGYAPCPFAKKALKDGRLKTVECDGRQDLWSKVAVECDSFSSDYSVVICLEEEPSQTYEEVESACVAMNEWFAHNKVDLWLLSFQTDFTMVFIQRLSELDDASKILEKTGYYESYSKEDYLNLILTRRRRREDARC